MNTVSLKIQLKINEELKKIKNFTINQQLDYLKDLINFHLDDKMNKKTETDPDNIYAIYLYKKELDFIIMKRGCNIEERIV